MSQHHVDSEKIIQYMKDYIRGDKKEKNEGYKKNTQVVHNRRG